MYWNIRGGKNLGARQGDWKLTDRAVEGERQQERFNIAKDPHETSEAARDYPGKVAELNELITTERRLDDSSKRDDVYPSQVHLVPLPYHLNQPLQNHPHIHQEKYQKSVANILYRYETKPFHKKLNNSYSASNIKSIFPPTRSATAYTKSIWS